MISFHIAVPLVAALSCVAVFAQDAKPAAKLWTVDDWSDWKLQETAPEGKMEILREIANAKPAKGAKPPGAEAAKAGVLVLGHSELLAVVKYEGENPILWDDYEIRWEGLRIEGSDFFAALTFPVGSKERCATFVAGGWGGWTIGVSCIDGLFANENESTRSMPFESGQWYDFTLQVNQHAIRALIDGEESFHLSLKGKTVSMHPSEIRKCVPLGFASFNTRGAVRNVRIRPLKAGELIAPE
jgi:hypothetical protein